NDLNFKVNNPGKCKEKTTFTPTPSNSCPNTMKRKTLYTTSYIQVDSAGNVAGSSAKYDATTKQFSTPVTYSYTIKVDDNLSYSDEDIGHSYFDKYNVNDFNGYLNQRKNNKKISEVGGTEGIQPPNKFKINSLSEANFNYKITRTYFDKGDYYIDITVNVYNLEEYYTNTPTAYEYGGNNVYFVPIKLDLCHGTVCTGEHCGSSATTGSTCNDTDYFESNKQSCCTNDITFFKNNALSCCSNEENFKTKKDYEDMCIINIHEPEKKKYILDSNTSCESGAKITSEFTKSITNTKITETINFETIKSPTVISGTGFEFDLDTVTNTAVYQANLSAGTYENPFSSYESFDGEHKSFISKINTDKENFNNNNLYTSQIIRFNAVFDNSGNPKNNDNLNPIFTNYSKIGLTSSDVINTDYYYKDTNYSCNSYFYACPTKKEPYKSCVGYGWFYTPTNTITTLAMNDSHGGTLINPNCTELSNGQNAIYKISKQSNEKVEYKYSMKLSEAYINKNKVDIYYDGSKVSNNNYISGGNKFYTNITTNSGYYPFYITIENGGVTGTVNTSKSDGTAYSCNYRVLNCAIEGTCPPSSCTDPDCINTEEPEPTPGTPNHYFRPISLTNPFPNARTIGPNWSSYVSGSKYTYIKENE
ncbi:MAG: hypothetical protein IJO57_00725, partial [Bacilli bacterium]|nr:hypothetical protein [Bacilli bacterium]